MELECYHFLALLDTQSRPIQYASHLSLHRKREIVASVCSSEAGRAWHTQVVPPLQPLVDHAKDSDGRKGERRSGSRLSVRGGRRARA